MNAYEMFSTFIWVLVIATIGSGLLWWIPKYVSQTSQAITTKWVLSAVSIIAVSLSVGRDFSAGEQNVRVYTVLMSTIVIVGISILFMYWYIPKYVSNAAQEKQQEFVLTIMSIILTVLNTASEVIRSMQTYTPPLLIAGRRRK